jgi:hypothetical protein
MTDPRKTVAEMPTPSAAEPTRDIRSALLGLDDEERRLRRAAFLAMLDANR